MSRPKDRSSFIFKTTFGDKGHHQPGATDVVIVSAFGRGDWLAGELASMGWKVTMADVTSHLVLNGFASGGSIDESLETEAMIDAEGPFGLFFDRELPASYKERFLEESDTFPVESGFSLWLSDGPIEFASHLGPLQLARAGVNQKTLGYLRGEHESDSREAKRCYRQVLHEPFRSAWPAGLAHQLASSTFSENHLALEKGNALPLFAPYSIRRPTLKGREWTHNALRARGVFVRYPARPLDVRVTGKIVDAIEIQDEFGGVEQAKSYVWTLTSAETRQLCFRDPGSEQGGLFSKLFPGGVTSPTWYWQRLRVDLQSENVDDALPIAFVVMDDVFLPWTHANVVVMRKRRESRAFDAWIKVPIRVRKERILFDQYMAKMAREIEERLQARMPLLNPRLSLPPTVVPGQAELLAPAMAVFSQNPFPALESLQVDNFFFCGPERWEKLDWLHAWRHQVTILTRLGRLKERWEAEARQHQAREERKRARRGEESP
jgi:hypothetical protein